eukprot:CAMPEP_0196140738 /NCGR_PEP_ID=MMETSP0910-20130528/7541_1 /TAXON_ID=49265 /ORGANISM="Thalassiosira rotula, Strain GSO102" /LENGTH=1048 /DNA_ID=CAMNT_0041401643 /DNA_START=104 /DNA_END=3250 /DNA_ORIENTATION=-
MSSNSSFPPDSSTHTSNGRGSIHGNDEASRGSVDLELGSFVSANNNISLSSTAGDNEDSNVVEGAEGALYSKVQEEDDDGNLTHQTISSPSANTASGVNIVGRPTTPDYSAEAESSIGPKIIDDDITSPPVPTCMHDAMIDAPPMPMTSALEAPMSSSKAIGRPFIYPDTGPSHNVAMTMTDVSAADRDSALKSKSLSGIESIKDDKGPPPPIAMTDAAKPEGSPFIKRWLGGFKKSAKAEQINDSAGPPDLFPDSASGTVAESLLKKPPIPNDTAASGTGLEAGPGIPLDLIPPIPPHAAPEDEESPPNPVSIEESIDELAEEEESVHNGLDFDPQIRVPEAYLVVEDDTRHSRNGDVPVQVAVNAVPVPIWYRQKRNQIAISLVCVVVTVLSIALGATMMSPSETMTMVVVEDSPTPAPSTSLSPSESSSPSFHPTLDPSDVPSQAPTTCMKRREIVLPNANSDINLNFAATNSIDTVAVAITEYIDQGSEGGFVSWGGVQLVHSSDISSWTYESADQSRIRILPARETRVVEFVARVAMTADTLVVGYYWRDKHGSYTNGALVFRNSIGNTWIEEAMLEPNDGHDYEGTFGSKQFGTSVAIHGNTVIVGAPLDSHDTGIGAAYVFVRSITDSKWTQQVKLLPTGGSNFGTTIALVDHTALISSHIEGAVYVFARSSDIWREEAKLKPNDVTSEDFFGLELAFWNNLALIGAPKKDKLRGAAYVFMRDWDGTWIEETKLLPESLSEGDQFGRALGLVDNVAFVGAPGHENTGAAFVFRRDSSQYTWGVWEEEKTKLLPPDGPSVFDDGKMLDRIAVPQFGNIVIPVMWTNVVVGVDAGYRQDDGDCNFNICVSTSFSLAYVFNICMDVKDGDEVPTLAASSSSTLAPTMSLRPTLSPSISRPPTITCHHVDIMIGVDSYPNEISWELKRTNDGAVIKSHQAGDTFLADYVCLQDGEYEFTIYDSFGDGLCCGADGGGYYTVTSRDTGTVMVQGGGDFGSNETFVFDIPFSSSAVAAGVFGTSSRSPSHPTPMQTPSQSATPTASPS